MKIEAYDIHPDGSETLRQVHDVADLVEVLMTKGELLNAAHACVNEIVARVEAFSGRRLSDEPVLKFEAKFWVGVEAQHKLLGLVYISDDLINPWTDLVFLGECTGDPVIEIVPSKYSFGKVAQPFHPGVEVTDHIHSFCLDASVKRNGSIWTAS